MHTGPKTAASSSTVSPERQDGTFTGLAGENRASLVPGDSGDLRVRWLAGLGSAAWAAFAVQHVARGLPLTSIVDLAAVGVLAMAAWSVRFGTNSGHLQLGVHLVGLLAASVLSGGPQSISLWFLALLPILAVMLVERRAALAWSAACAAGTGFVWVAPAGAPVEFVPGPMDHFAGQLLLTVVAAGVGLLVRRAFDERAVHLERARDEAVAATRARELFLARVSHEVRTPLNGILGLTRILRESPLDAEQRELVRTLERSEATLLALVNEILDFSALRAGGIVLERSPVDVVALLEDILDLHAPLAAERNLDLGGRITSDTPRRVLGDAERLRQILANLVSNAVKYTAIGFVEVGMRRGAPGLSIEVRDSGPGLGTQSASSLFEPFVRGEGPGSDLSPGTGLGLAAVRSLVEAMGGTLDVASTPKGTTFQVTVPLREVATTSVPAEPGTEGIRVAVVGLRAVAKAALEEQLLELGVTLADESDGADLLFVSTEVPDLSDRLAPHKPPVVVLATVGDAIARRLATSGAAVVRLPTRRADVRAAVRDGIRSREKGRVVSANSELWEVPPLRILVAEDNPVNQTVIALFLKRLGQTPTLVGDGAEACVQARERTWDLILMDLRMPVLDGIAASRRIREMTIDQPRIVAMSASVLPEHRTACAAAGVNDFLDKPVELERLHALLCEIAAKPNRPDTRPTEDPRGPGWAALEGLARLADPSQLREMFDSWDANSEALASAIEAGCERQDWSEVRRAAHQLKGSGTMYGAPEASEVAGLIEDRVGRPEWDSALVLALREALRTGVERHARFLARARAT